MNLRSLLLPAVACVLMAGSAHASPQVSGHRLMVDAADVQQYLDGSFPRSQKALGGLLALTVSQPRLTLPTTPKQKVPMPQASDVKPAGS